jgi:hypothetical protein
MGKIFNLSYNAVAKICSYLLSTVKFVKFFFWTIIVYVLQLDFTRYQIQLHVHVWKRGIETVPHLFLRTAVRLNYFLCKSVKTQSRPVIPRPLLEPLMMSAYYQSSEYLQLVLVWLLIPCLTVTHWMLKLSGSGCYNSPTVISGQILKYFLAIMLLCQISCYKAETKSNR